MIFQKILFPKFKMNPAKLRAARESRGLNQRELAEVAGISMSQMSRVEAGKRRLHLDEAERIASRLNLNILEITEGDFILPAKERNKTASLPLPEGLAIIQYPAELSPQSRDELTEWLELMGRIISRQL